MCGVTAGAAALTRDVETFTIQEAKRTRGHLNPSDHRRQKVTVEGGRIE